MEPPSFEKCREVLCQDINFIRSEISAAQKVDPDPFTAYDAADWFLEMCIESLHQRNSNVRSLLIKLWNSDLCDRFCLTTDEIPGSKIQTIDPQTLWGSKITKFKSRTFPKSDGLKEVSEEESNRARKKISELLRKLYQDFRMVQRYFDTGSLESWFAEVCIETCQHIILNNNPTVRSSLIWIWKAFPNDHFGVKPEQIPLIYIRKSTKAFFG